MSLLMDALRKADRAQQTPDNQDGKPPSTEPEAEAVSDVAGKEATVLEWEDELQPEPFPVSADQAPEPPVQTPDNARQLEWNTLLDELDELSASDDSQDGLEWEEEAAEAEKSPWPEDELVLEEAPPLHHASLIEGDAADLTLMDGDEPAAEAPVAVPTPAEAAESAESVGAESTDASADGGMLEWASEETAEPASSETPALTLAEPPAEALEWAEEEADTVPETTDTSEQAASPAEELEWTTDEAATPATGLEWTSEQDSGGMEWVSPATPQAAAKLYQATQRPPAVKRTPWGLISAVILALLAAAAGGYYFYLESTPAPRTRIAKPAAEAVPPRPSVLEQRPPPARPVTPAETPIEAEAVEPIPAQPPPPAKAEPERMVEAERMAEPVPERLPPLPREVPPPPSEPEQAPLSAEERAALLRLEKRRRLRAALNQGYAAYYASDAEQAESAYRQALRIAPHSRQALLGLAGSLVQQGKLAAAHQRYREVLRRYPEDPVAQSVLLNFAATTGSPADESRLKSQLAESPQNAYLHFALGNLFSRRQQWSEAQQAYFNAYHYDNTNPNYAYNLAVSLEHLGQSRPALDYYEKAQALAAQHPGSFDTATLQQRITTLRHDHE